jgi:hypothetical protein
MRHIVAIILKFIVVLVFLEILLSLLTALTVAQILVVSAAVTLISYLVADLLILTFSNNAVATLSDAVLIFLTIWAFNYVPAYGFIGVGDAVVCAVVLGVIEIFYHRYVARAVLPNRRERRGGA